MNATLAGVLLIAVGACAYGQSMISAKSGLVNYTEGEVLLDGQEIEAKVGSFPQIKENQTVDTKEGRAEILLMPGVFFRVGENASFRMISTRLVDTRVELLSGTAVIEAAQMDKETDLTIVAGDAQIAIEKAGVYQIQSEPRVLKVYAGQAGVSVAGQNVAVKKGRELALAGAIVPEKFNTKTGDSLARWSRRRAGVVAMANVSAAHMLSTRGLSWGANDWFFNSYYGTYTFVPMRGAFDSYYGYSFWSPRAVYAFYDQYAYRSRDSDYSRGYGRSHDRDSRAGGYSRIPQTAVGSSGTTASAPARTTTSSSSSSAPISRGTGGGDTGRRR